MQVLAVGTEEMLKRKCVDCRTRTGGFCEYCYAKDRLPEETWADYQATPLCSDCEEKRKMCHFCRDGKGGGKPGRPDGKGGGKPCIVERHFFPIRGKGSGTPSGQATATQGGNQTETQTTSENTGVKVRVPRVFEVW